MVIKILVAVSVYLLLGELLFSSALVLLGGKDEFKSTLGDTEREADLAYFLCHLGVVIFWPFFVIDRFINRHNKGDEK